MRIIKNIVIRILRRLSVYPTPLLSKVEFFVALNFLRPIDNGHELIRIGGTSDGGYLVPNDLSGIATCISPGVAETMDFELDLWEKFKIPSLMYDASVEIPHGLNSGQKFVKKFVGASSTGIFVSMHEIISTDLDSKSGDLIGQIDIESAEYAFLTSSSDADLKRFRILVVEFHEIDRWIQRKYYLEVIEPLFVRLFNLFDLVHAHPNNNGGVFKYKGKMVPNVIELTFHRKDRLIDNLGYAKLPHKLDYQNVRGKKSIYLD
jgi:hypothetical protein